MPAPTAAGAAASTMRRLISAGDYGPGEQLFEEETATRLQISRNTLREAFAMLSADGIVVRIPYRGVFISSPDAEAIDDLYSARAAIEPAAIMWGEALDLMALDEIVANAERALREGRVPDVAANNQLFHRTLVAGMGSTTLDEMMDGLLARMRLAFVRALASKPDFHAEFVANNRQVVDKLVKADRSGAATTLHASLTTAAARLRGILKALDTPGRGHP